MGDASEWLEDADDLPEALIDKEFFEYALSPC